jgi:hypothetical protein
VKLSVSPAYSIRSYEYMNLEARRPTALYVQKLNITEGAEQVLE